MNGIECELAPQLTTTTLSTIAVRAEPHTTIVVAVLKSLNSIEFRIDEMKPKLLDIGSTISENFLLLKSHNDLFDRLREKRQQVEDLLQRTQNLVSEQQEAGDVAVYEGMAESLCGAWKDLSRKLELRGYMLRDTANLYKTSEEHHKLTEKIDALFHKIKQQDVGSVPKYIAESKAFFKELLELTTCGLDLGCSIINQIRVLGGLSNNDDRPQEIVKACLIVEDLMIKMAQSWEIAEAHWSIECPRLEQLISELQHPSSAADSVAAWTKKLADANEWLNCAREKWNTVGQEREHDAIVAALLHDVKRNQKALKKISHEILSAEASSSLSSQSGELLELYDLLAKKIEDRLQLHSRIDEFFKNADALPCYLQKIRNEVEKAETHSIAGELGPLAQQKAIAVIDEGTYLIERLGSDHPDTASIHSKLKELKIITTDVVEFARRRIKQAKSELSERLSIQITRLENWIKCTPELILASNLDLGDASFLLSQKKFFAEVMLKEQEAAAIAANSTKLLPIDSEKLRDIEQQLRNLKDVLESRIQLANTYNQVMKLDRDVDAELQQLTTSMESRVKESDEQNIRTQVNTIQENFLQERHQASKFNVLCDRLVQEGKDNSMPLTGASEYIFTLVKNKISKIEEVILRWQSWERTLGETKNANKKALEEIEKWKTEMVEFVQILETQLSSTEDEAAVAKDWQSLLEQIVSSINMTISHQEKLTEIRKFVELNNEQILLVQELRDELEHIVAKLKKLLQNITVVNQRDYVLRQHETRSDEATFREQTQQNEEGCAPHFITNLNPAKAVEGSCFLFSACLDANPTPSIRWFKDSVELFNSKNNHQFSTCIDGIVKLFISQVSSGDGGNYRIRAENVHGVAESWASLQVIAQSALSQEDHTTLSRQEQPTFVRELQSVSVKEGDPFVLDCGVTGIPDPHVIWYQNESVVSESDRVRLHAAGGNRTLECRNACSGDFGIYTAKATNSSGETTCFCCVSVIPATPIKKVPPPTPPKPSTLCSPVQRHIPQQIVQQSSAAAERSFVVKSNANTMQSSGYCGSESNQGFQSEFTGSSPQSQFSSPMSKYDNVMEELRQTTNAMRQIESAGPTESGLVVGYSSMANSPEFIRPFHPKYTLNEGEKCHVDCLMIGNPRPRVQWFFNEQPIKSGSFAEPTNVGDSYALNFCPAKLEHSGYYRMVAENVRGRMDFSILIHVRPKCMISAPRTRRYSTQHSSAQRSQQCSMSPKTVALVQNNGRSYSTPPQPIYIDCPSPVSYQANSRQQILSASSLQQQNRGWSSIESPTKMIRGQPPHFIQTIVSCVASIGDEVKFEALVTGWPAPEIAWSKDGVELSSKMTTSIISEQGGSASIFLSTISLKDAGKYMCTARNSSGVATTSAQLIVRPRTIAPDFIWRLVSEELALGDPMKWTVKVIGDPEPAVVWLKDGEEIKQSKRIATIKDDLHVYSLLIDGVLQSDAGQITCFLVNSAGEARSTADLVVRQPSSPPGNYIHITKVTQEKQVRGEEVAKAQSVTIEPPPII